MRVGFLLSLLACAQVGAQPLIVTNGRIIDGTGTVIDRGFVSIEDGRIVSVASGMPSTHGTKSLDAEGRTVMPGMIDTHVHVFIGSQLPSSEAAINQWIEEELPRALHGYLAAGLTTIVSAGDFLQASLTARDRLASGELDGPRLLVAGPLFTAPGGHPSSTVCRSDPLCVGLLSMEVDDPEQARQDVRRLARAGVDAIGVIVDSLRVPEAQLDHAVLAAIANQAGRLNLPTLAHLQTTQDALKAAAAGITRLAHMPGAGGVIDRATAIARFREASIPVSSTTHVHAPLVDETGAQRNHRGEPYTAREQAGLTEVLANVRQLRDAGVIVAFATDQSMGTNPAQLVMHEIETLSRVLSAEEIVASLTRDAARYLDLEGEIGTLESGKAADLVIVDGDPLEDLAALANIVAVIRDGKLVVDNR